MKGITGLEAAARMRERYPEVRVVILSMHSGEEACSRRCAPAPSATSRDAATGELELALRSVMRGESWLSPSVSRQVVEGYMHRTGGETAPEVLTARQREVLKLVAGGKHQGDRFQPLGEDRGDASRADHGAPGHPRCRGTCALCPAHRACASRRLTRLCAAGRPLA